VSSMLNIDTPQGHRTNAATGGFHSNKPHLL
jgi:hypothetical protein